ncbi:MAG: IS630 family transposase, partial [Acidobacteria bacterium]|nr:IS630 family transposase [Acidobacteriota bacterium]
RYSVKCKLLKHLQQCIEAGTRVRYLIIINLLNGRGAYQTAAVLGVHNTVVYRVVKRFKERGEWGLWDGREDNGATKLDEHYLTTLYQVVRSSPPQYGWRRPTWTREMLVETLTRQTRVRIHVATMSRALALIHARRGRPRPTVGCPWSKTAKTQRLQAIHRLVDALPRRQVAVYEDEVDIHLNPKIGWDWMVRGQQKEVVTPGQNVKRYLAGALDVRSGLLTWAEGDRKASSLFLALLDRLRLVYGGAAVIHVVLDNYRIHDSKITQAALQSWGGRVRLHFLPPYCPQENKIERVWQDLHANVTRNHTRTNMESLMQGVREYLWRRNRVAARIEPCQAA